MFMPERHESYHVKSSTHRLYYHSDYLRYLLDTMLSCHRITEREGLLVSSISNGLWGRGLVSVISPD